MNQKSIFSVVIVISVVLLAACSATPTSTVTTNNNVIPTIAGNPNTAVTTAPTATDNSNTSAPTVMTGNNSNLACSNGATSASPTVEETEGPYYKSGSPEQADLFTNGMTG